jgi:hypothetical protein
MVRGRVSVEWHLFEDCRRPLRERNAPFAEQKATLDGSRMYNKCHFVLVRRYAPERIGPGKHCCFSRFYGKNTGG